MTNLQTGVNLVTAMICAYQHCDLHHFRPMGGGAEVCSGCVRNSFDATKPEAAPG